ncbi:hypothetical protein AC579_845 [Pseudocercospora musae]|uniref:Histone H4 n=1 Tax=Pseudocercospora musae TaxID=113226 RepID=A0A139HU63_9PEZI|nr:hypothetical protein AC579_845 [Pseudocercospora musae]
MDMIPIRYFQLDMMSMRNDMRIALSTKQLAGLPIALVELFVSTAVPARSRKYYHHSLNRAFSPSRLPHNGKPCLAAASHVYHRVDDMAREGSQILGASPSANRYTGPKLGSKAVRKGVFRGGPFANGNAVKGGAKRHRVLRDNIQGITKPDIRRLARRGGVKRISTDIYEAIRLCLKEFLKKILTIVCCVVDYQDRKTVTTSDVVFALNRIGKPIYGFGGIKGST